MGLSGRVNKWERYNGPYTDEIQPLVDVMVHTRRRTPRRGTGAQLGPPQTRVSHNSSSIW